MAQWWDSANVKWEYIDTDGDRITFSTEAEWQECIRVHQQANMTPVRLTVSRVKGGAFAHPPAVRATEAPESPASPPISEPKVEALPPAPVEICEAILFSQKPTGEREPVPTSAPAIDATRAIMIALYGEGVVKALWSGRVEPCLNAVVKVINRTPGAKWDPTMQVDVDVDVRALRSRASSVACDLMDHKQVEAARDLLLMALQLPTDDLADDIVVRYNLACALALEGNADRAMEQLSIAVAHGYVNFDHMGKDEDLAALRGREDFRVLSRMGPQSETPATAPEQAGPAIPLSFLHELHPCTLTLTDLRRVRGYFPFGTFVCDACNGRGLGESYHCMKCGYDMCKNCAKQIFEAPAPTTVPAPPAPTPVVEAVKPEDPKVVEAFPAAKEVFSFFDDDDNESAQPVVTPVAAPPVPAVVAPTTQVPKASSPACDALLALFPGLDVETAEEILRHTNGNVHRAVELFLGA
jgi:hypothetical protein